ncbi:MAG: NarK/NasA family nitrate transporter [Bacteroidetes bacterium]|nr:NarK/NasA family nitrate transporter [Bacteroidota bacterium]
MSLKEFAKSGHLPTLITSFLYFDVSFMVWMVNAAMAPFISQALHLSPMQKGFMLSVPVFAGAFLRIPLGLVAEIIGRKSAALLGMAITIMGMLYGFFFADSFTSVLILGALLGVAGASFSVALPLGSGWFPPKYQGLAMGIVGAGNSGTILAGFFAPSLANVYGWNHVYLFFAAPVLIVMALILFLAKEPPNGSEHKTIFSPMKVLLEKDIWVFNLFYYITFGGFIGFASFVPTFIADQYGVDKVSAGEFMVLMGFAASILRIFGGGIADRIGGINVLTIIFSVLAFSSFAAGLMPSIKVMTILLFIMSAMMGSGNGSVFQLLPLRFPTTKSISTGVVGEFGALGGALIPMSMGYSLQTTGSYSFGFYFYGITVLIALLLLLFVRKKWTSSWVGKGGRALPLP